MEFKIAADGSASGKTTAGKIIAKFKNWVFIKWCSIDIVL